MRCVKMLRVSQNKIKQNTNKLYQKIKKIITTFTAVFPIYLQINSTFPLLLHASIPKQLKIHGLAVYWHLRAILLPLQVSMHSYGIIHSLAR